MKLLECWNVEENRCRWWVTFHSWWCNSEVSSENLLIFRAFPAKSTSPSKRPGNIRTQVGCPNDFFLCWVNGDVTQLVQVRWLREPNCIHISHSLSCPSRHTNSSCSQRCPLLYCFYIALQLLNLQDICDASAGCSSSYFESKVLHQWKLHTSPALTEAFIFLKSS